MDTSEVEDVGPTGTSFRFVRACVRTRGLVAEWNQASNMRAPLSIFPFARGWLSRFPCESAVDSSEFSEF